MSADFNDDGLIREDRNDYDIIIIGAGLAGLACAYNILKRNIGLDVLILEANSEAGGRILSNDFSDTYHANIVQAHATKLIESLQIDIEHGPCKGENREAILYAKGKTSRLLPRFYGADVHHFLRTLKENALDKRFVNYTEHEDAKHLAETSVEEFLRSIVHIPYARTLCRAYICSVCATENLKGISTLWLLVMLNRSAGFLNRWKVMIGDLNRYFVRGGMIRITNELSSHILREQGTIRYAEAVNEIAFNDDRVHVYTEENHFRCEYVVVAIPASLRNRILIKPFQGRIDTEPLYTPAENVFFNILYKKPLRADDSVIHAVTTWDPSSNLNIVYDATQKVGKTLLAGFLAESNVLSRREKGLFDALSDIYNTDASEYFQYKEFDESLINTEGNAGCPMSVMRPSSIHDHINCTGVTCERVLFASSEYASNWPGTIDGAIQSGEEAALAILQRLRPQVLTFHEISGIGHSEQPRARTECVDRQGFIKMSVIQYLGLFLNVSIFLSFLNVAYD